MIVVWFTFEIMIIRQVVGSREWYLAIRHVMMGTELVFVCKPGLANISNMSRFGIVAKRYMTAMMTQYVVREHAIIRGIIRIAGQTLCLNPMDNGSMPGVD